MRYLQLLNHCHFPDFISWYCGALIFAQICQMFVQFQIFYLIMFILVYHCHLWLLFVSRPDLSNSCSFSNILIILCSFALSLSFPLFIATQAFNKCPLSALIFRPDLPNVCSILNILILLCSFALPLSCPLFIAIQAFSKCPLSTQTVVLII